MRKPIIAGNWKMFKTRDEALSFIYAVNNEMPSIDEVDTVICSQFTILRCLVKRQGENLRIGAQNMHFAENGAYTGEVAPEMLTSLGVTYVIIGHSERRAMFNETDESVNKKLHAAYKHGLKPILCVGETLDEREAGLTEKRIKEQITADLAGLTKEQVKDLVIAYEPIWAIGTGKTATKEQANETISAIRKVVAGMYGQEVADKVRIQYGGSVKPNTIRDQMAMSDIDGALVGGASLVASDFAAIVNY